ncbi:MAG: nickel pincer cofactor biosynthesis protein LarC [Proteobacteria bacterium]|nr:nickel pincer cofactor biosynthesis protein LarC [Pseudomonadota bacterium]
MKTLFFDCSMGAAGDMIVAALLELLPEPEKFVQKFNALGQFGLGSVALQTEKVSRCGIVGTHARMLVTPSGHDETVEEQIDDHDHHDAGEAHCHGHHDHHDADEAHCHGHHDHHDADEAHCHGHHDHHDADEAHCHGHHVGGQCHEHGHVHGMRLSDICGILSKIGVSESVRHHCEAIFELIASAESHVHGCPVEQVHFHEVGQLDALADILAACMLLEELAPDRIVASAVCTGKGTVQCAHGILPVPAPATAHILCGTPCFQGRIEAELCTPTGAAVLVHFVDEFAEMPLMVPEKIGYGMGSRSFADAANALRVVFGSQNTDAGIYVSDMVEIHVNVDDMTGEQIGFAVRKLLENGANDVWTIPIVMKKGRPAQTLACLVPLSQSEKYARLMLQYTSSFGVRIIPCRRVSLSRTVSEVKTDYGIIRRKCSSDSNIRKSKWEYDDLAEVASRLNITISELLEKLQ